MPTPAWLERSRNGHEPVKRQNQSANQSVREALAWCEWICQSVCSGLFVQSVCCSYGSCLLLTCARSLKSRISLWCSCSSANVSIPFELERRRLFRTFRKLWMKVLFWVCKLKRLREATQMTNDRVNWLRWIRILEFILRPNQLELRLLATFEVVREAILKHLLNLAKFCTR